MQRSLDEHRQAHPKLTAAQNPEKRRELFAIAQEVVRLDALTGDPAWDYFLRYLAASAKAATRHRDNEFAKLRDPMLVNDDEIAKCKVKVAMVDERLRVLEELLLLPKMLKENGEKARAIIAEMERDAA
jgi:hypothetical protein